MLNIYIPTTFITAEASLFPVVKSKAREVPPIWKMPGAIKNVGQGSRVIYCEYSIFVLKDEELSDKIYKERGTIFGPHYSFGSSRT